MTVLVRPGAWIVAAFVAGSGAGAAGLHWATQMGAAPTGAPKTGDERDRKAARASSSEAGEDPATNSEEPAAGATIDRAALRAALAELLAEEGANHDSDEEDAGQGESASEALMRLEQAYRAELELQAWRDQEDVGGANLVEDAVEESVGSVSKRGSPQSAFLARERAADHPREPADGPEVLPSDVRTAENAFRGGQEVVAIDPRVESEPVAVVTPVQPVFFAPVAFPAPAPGSPSPSGARTFAPSRTSPLSRPLPSAHDQSPWSPVDYSRHHNPWGPTFGRHVP